MLWTIVGLLIATAVSIEGAISSERSRNLKLALIGLALAGATVAAVSAHQDNAEKNSLRDLLQQANTRAEDANRQLAAQRPILDLVDLTVGDLGTLNRLSAGEKFYVRISAGSKSEMERFLTRIEKRFQGARSSGLVKVRELRNNCSPNDLTVSCWGLVFGNNLNPAAAEVFERFANENGFPPPGQRAEIMPEGRD
ncbi:MAG: hypothetical protein HIU93_00680 [Acidobacteria bacterium]|nr:hypothetical protein [Acidobacteriota bacterium]MBW4044186.1 hypothetical protein [Acidobacteriota bacterium]